MKTPQPHSVKSSQKSRWYGRELPREKDYYALMYPRMLIDDIHLGLIPSDRRGEHIEISIEGGDGISEILRKAFETDRDVYDCEEAVARFIDEVSRSMAYFGETFYEIVFFSNPSGSYTGFKLAPIPNWTITKRLGYLIQTQEDDERTTRVRIPMRDVVRFVIPRSNGGVRRYRSILKTIASLSNRDTPMKYIQPHKPTTFDFSHYYDLEKINLAKASRQLGWHSRQLYVEQISEFYLVQRYLRFEKWKAALREYIIRQINEMLKTVGEKMKFNASVGLKGMISSDEIDDLMTEMQAGKMNFSAAIARVANKSILEPT